MDACTKAPIPCSLDLFVVLKFSIFFNCRLQFPLIKGNPLFKYLIRVAVSALVK